MIENLHLPTFNALMNAFTTLLLIMGFVFIKQKKIFHHRMVMSAAFFTSILFLIGYLTHHALHGSTKFTGQGLSRWVYFSILISHTILATAIVPLVLITLQKAWRGHFELHKKWARRTWPLWIYVSITGVIIYFMLYSA